MFIRAKQGSQPGKIKNKKQYECSLKSFHKPLIVKETNDYVEANLIKTILAEDPALPVVGSLDIQF